MHQTGAVRRNDGVGARQNDVAESVPAHLRGYRGLGHGERATEAATFVRPLQLDQLEAANGAKQRTNLVRRRRLRLARRREAESTQCVTAYVYGYAMRELCAQG